MVELLYHQNLDQQQSIDQQHKIPQRRINKLSLHIGWRLDQDQYNERNQHLVCLPIRNEQKISGNDGAIEEEKKKLVNDVIYCGGNHALGFEKWRVGMELKTKRRTISEYDIIQFTQLTGYQSENLFGDMEYLKNVAGHEKRLAPGLLTASIADALIVGSGILENYAVALVNITDLKATFPVYAGDTIQVFLKVLQSKPLKSKPNHGIVTTQQRVINQNGKLVMVYNVSRLLKKSITTN